MKTNRRQVIGAGLGLTSAVALAGYGKAVAKEAASEELAASQIAQIAGDLAKYASFGIMRSGRPGDLGAAKWISDRLSAAGFAVDSLPVPVPYFDAAKSVVNVGDREIEVAPQPVVMPTDANGIRAQAVLVRDQYDARHAGNRIAFVVLPYGRHAAIFSPAILSLLNAVVNAGAKAAVIVTTGPTGLVIALNTRLKPMAPVPIALMAPRDLPAVARAIAEAQGVTLTVTGEAQQLQTTSLIATRKAGKHWLAFSTPRSGWYTCVGERAPGTAIFLEMCDWAAKRFPKLSLFAINSGGHELDFVGMHQAIKKGPPPADTLIWTHLGAGLATRDLLELGAREIGLLPTADPQRVMMASKPLMEAVTKAFDGISGYERPIPAISGAGELSGIIDLGYEKAFAGLGVHRWCHTPEDSLDKVDARLVLPVLDAHKAVVEQAVREAGLL